MRAGKQKLSRVTFVLMWLCHNTRQNEKIGGRDQKPLPFGKVID
jgi:hypothetical protein